MRIVLLGYIVRGPYGALCWHHFQFMLGLKKLGHDVLFIEDSDDYPGLHNYNSIQTANRLGFAFINELFDRYGYKEFWSYFDSLTGEWHGLNKTRVIEFCTTADIVINLSGINPVRDWWQNIPIRVFLDTDCSFTQIRMLQEPPLIETAKMHTHHFSFGENMGQSDCKVPTAGFNWIPTRQPVALEAWKVTPSDKNASWTTIMHWDSCEPVEFNGEKFGMKSQSFEDYFELPKQVPEESFILGIKCSEEVQNRLRNSGWGYIDPLIPTKSPWTYQHFIASSKGEFSVAKHAFVYSKCGYLSERSLNYMASGRPVIIQDTGFSKFFPIGNGLFAFSSIEEATEAFNIVKKDYQSNCRKAREIVEQYADSSIVLRKLLNEVY